jgi:hypothetical protein
MSVTLSWDAPVVDDAGAPFDPANITSYQVFRDSVFVGNGDLVTRTFVDTSPSPGPHDYHVNAVSAAGVGPDSLTVNVVVPSGIPGAPTNVQGVLS